jgi:hypothetical protein
VDGARTPPAPRRIPGPAPSRRRPMEAPVPHERVEDRPRARLGGTSQREPPLRAPRPSSRPRPTSRPRRTTGRPPTGSASGPSRPSGCSGTRRGPRCSTGSRRSPSGSSAAS